MSPSQEWHESPPCPFPIAVQEHVPLSTLSTLRLGGAARYYCAVTSIQDLSTFMHFCYTHRVRYFLLGRGSNCLFDDRGFAGLVLHNKINFLEVFEDNRLHVGAGYSFAHLGSLTARKGLRGLEFASGIPGSVGGAIFMNAGAQKGETADCLESVTYLFPNGEMQTLPRESLLFGYRTSPFQRMNGVILSAYFRLFQDEEAMQRQRAMLAQRVSTQPYRHPSAGCIFANPPAPHPSAGALIDKAGLKGFSIGGVSVSNLHANFLIHTGNGSSAQMQALIAHVHSQILLQTGIDLKREVRYIAFNEDPLSFSPSFS